MTACCNNFLAESIVRSSHQRYSVQKSALENSAYFTRFPVKFAKFLRISILKNNCEQLLLHCQLINLLLFFNEKLFQEEMVISKKCNFLGHTLVFLPARKARSLYITFIIFFSLEYHELSKHCS